MKKGQVLDAGSSSEQEMTSAPTTLVGIDVGFGLVKLVSNYVPNVEVFTSAVTPGSKSNSKLFELDTIDKSSMVVTVEEGTFFVGDQAMDIPTGGSKRTQVRDRAADTASRVLFKTGLALAVPPEDGEYDVFVVTGLPNDDYELSIADKLLDFLQQSFEIEFHLSDSRSIKKKINVVGAEVLRQPEGTVTYNQFVFNKKTFLAPSEHARDSLGEIDFGHFTTDFALFREGIMIEDSTVSGSTLGVAEVYNHLKTKLIRKFDEMGYEFKPKDKHLDAAVQTGVIHYLKKDVDVSQEVTECAKYVASIIAKDILDAWGNETNLLEGIIISGGGSHLFAEHLLKEFEARKKQPFDMVDLPQYSNALGFYMYAIIAHESTYSHDILFEQYITPVFKEAK